MHKLIDLENQEGSMRLIYTLSEEIKNDPEHVRLAQELTLDKTRPLMGLKGAHGLFGSDEWWNSIYTKKMKLKYVSGVITKTYYAGMDSDRRHNSYELVLDNGSLHQESFYATNDKDIGLYKTGKKVLIVYALDELKRQSGERKYLEIPVEIAISNDVVPIHTKSANKLQQRIKKSFAFLARGVRRYV
jgi:hypothetical protein